MQDFYFSVSCVLWVLSFICIGIALYISYRGNGEK